MDASNARKRTVPVVAYRHAREVSMAREVASLIRTGPITRIFAHGLAGAAIVGTNLQLYQFRWHKIAGVYRKGLVGVLERPIASFTAEQLLDLSDMMERGIALPFRATEPAGATMH